MILTDYKIAKISGVCFDEIICYTLDQKMATVQYIYQQKERVVTVETRDITFERNV